MHKLIYTIGYKISHISKKYIITVIEIKRRVFSRKLFSIWCIWNYAFNNLFFFSFVSFQGTENQIQCHRHSEADYNQPKRRSYFLDWTWRCPGKASCSFQGLEGCEMFLTLNYNKCSSRNPLFCCFLLKKKRETMIGQSQEKHKT